LKLEYVVVAMLIVYTVILALTGSDPLLAAVALALILLVRMAVWWLEREKERRAEGAG